MTDNYLFITLPDGRRLSYLEFGKKDGHPVFYFHIHNVRLMWLKAADPGLLKGQNKIEKETKISKKILADELIDFISVH